MILDADNSSASSNSSDDDDNDVLSVLCGPHAPPEGAVWGLINPEGAIRGRIAPEGAEREPEPQLRHSRRVTQRVKVRPRLVEDPMFLISYLLRIPTPALMYCMEQGKLQALCLWLGFNAAISNIKLSIIKELLNMKSTL